MIMIIIIITIGCHSRNDFSDYDNSYDDGDSDDDDDDDDDDYYNDQTNVSLHLKREIRLKIMFAGKRQAPDSS